MKSILLSVSLVLCIVSTTLAALAFGPAQVHPNRPGECYHEASESYHKAGDSWTEEGCTEITCVSLNVTGTPKLYISYTTCGRVGVDAPCYLVEDKTKSYPDCCPEPVCPDSEEEIENSRPAEKEEELKKVPVSTVDIEGRTSDAPISVELPSSTANQQQEPKNRQGHGGSSNGGKFNDNEYYNWQEEFRDREETENELPGDSFRLLDIFGKGFPWEDDYTYNDVMDNHVDDTQYNSPDYFSPYGKRLSSGFSQDDFNIKRFKWF